jgi:formylglycine-generating enzyme required for sulfatase activity
MDPVKLHRLNSLVRFVSVCIALAAATFVACAAERASTTTGRREALVIGNDSYRHVPPLGTARTDARALAAALRKYGFDVTLLVDVDQRAFKAAIRQFKARVAGADDTVFFYAGHGVEFAGSNYLLPIDVEFGDSEEQLRDDGIRLQRILDDLREQKVRFSLAIIDACRDNPFKQNGRALSGRGLGPTTPATGQMVVYSAGAGQSALDALGADDHDPHGLFTRVLLKELDKPGTPVDQIVRAVRDEVARLAKNAGHDQVPALYDQTLGKFYFRPPLSGDAVAANDPSRAQRPAAESGHDARSAESIEDKLWNLIEDSSDATDFEDYLKRYPNGRYVALAQRKLRMVRQSLSAAGGSGRSTSPTPTPSSAPTTSPAPEWSIPSISSSAVAKPSASSFTPGEVFRDCGDCPEMVTIPAGSFQMGSPASEAERFDNEGPVHEVRIARAIAVGKYKVTRGQYAAFVKATGHGDGDGCWVFDAKGRTLDKVAEANWRRPGFEQDDQHPAVCVNWGDARAYAAWMSRTTGQRYRLLSEAEAEYVARAGSRTSRPWGDDASVACRYANVGDRSLKDKMPDWFGDLHSCSDEYAFTSPVGKFEKNAQGLYDTLGNVWEWTEDCWNENYTAAPGDGSAWSSGDCAKRVLRGGSWSGKPRAIRSANRFRYDTAHRYSFLGFRVARALP